MEQTFKSKRNKVLLINSEQSIVAKHFERLDDWGQEYKRYQVLSAHNVKVPKILDAEPGVLHMAYVEGETVLEILEAYSRGDYPSDKADKVWAALADWLVYCFEQTGFLMKDQNLRNFIYNCTEQCIYGVDFEGEISAEPAEAVSMLLAYICLYDLPEQMTHRKVYEYLKKRLAEAFKIEAEILEQKTEEACVFLIDRRRKKNNCNLEV